MSLTGWSPRYPTVRQPHRTKSRGIGGPGGPLRTTDAQVSLAVEAGVTGRVGLTGGEWAREKKKPFTFTGALSRRFSRLGRCRLCREYPQTYGRGKRPVDGTGLCVEHAQEVAANPLLKRLL